MISKIVNLSTGPVSITREVRAALAEEPLSHRSNAFKHLYHKTTSLLNQQFNVKDTFIMTGSGTLANEAMLSEIRCIEGKGLILSNGEFGQRLVKQALRHELTFINYQVKWGECLNLHYIENTVKQQTIKWMLFVYCETSTGVVNDLKGISKIGKDNGCYCFVDCMSIAGTEPVNLSEVSMATASSGKALGSIPGLAIVFSNIEPTEKKKGSLYLNLKYYSSKDFIPFTLSSNLIKALYIGALQKLHQEQFLLAAFYRNVFFKLLKERDLIPFASEKSSVFTIVLNGNVDQTVQRLFKRNILIGYESSYLRKRDWCQLATFGYYNESELKYAETIVPIVLDKALETIID